MGSIMMHYGFPFGNVLVIGGCGFLGHHIVRLLLESRRANVSVFDATTTQNRFHNVSYTTGNICSESDVQKVLAKEKPRVIFHAPMHTAFTAYFEPEAENTIVEGTRTLLKCAKKYDTVKALVYTSSAYVVHDTVSNLVYVDERGPYPENLKRIDPYFEAIREAEKLVLLANRQPLGNGHVILTTALRPTDMFGDGDHDFTTTLILSAKQGYLTYQFGEGLFEYTYVRDAAKAHMLAAAVLLRTFEGPRSLPASMLADGETFFITSEEAWPFWHFVHKLADAAGSPTDPSRTYKVPIWLLVTIAVVWEWLVWIFSRGKKRSTLTGKEVRHMTKTLSLVMTFNIDKAKKRLGYRPTYTLEQAVIKTGNWWYAEETKNVTSKELTLRDKSLSM